MNKSIIRAFVATALAAVLTLPIACAQQAQSTPKQSDTVPPSPSSTATMAAGAYDFPVKGGTDAWRALGSHDAMIAACQVPDSLLAGMPTDALVETILNYPLYGDIFAHNSVQEGFDAVAAGFNGLQELLTRSDAGTILLKVYEDVDPAAVEEEWSLPEKGQYAFKLYYVEITIAQTHILRDLDGGQMKELVSEALRKNEATMGFADIYGRMSQECAGLVVARALQQAQYPDFLALSQADTSVQHFLRTGSFPMGTTLESILGLGQRSVAK